MVTIGRCPQFSFKFDFIFADPPYFLSNGGISVQAGKIVSVDKGAWYKGLTPEETQEFSKTWLSLCREKLKGNGTIWISGTYHNIFTVAISMSQRRREELENANTRATYRKKIADIALLEKGSSLFASDPIPTLTDLPF